MSGERKSRARLGEWRWYFGMDDDDDEMSDCGTREDAIRGGLREFNRGDSFWIVEARMLVRDEKAMGDGKRDTAPFAETRNGCWITVGVGGAALNQVQPS